MKRYLKFLLKWAAWFVTCFAVIWLVVFLGGWKLFESRDAVMLEIGFALILSVFVSIAAEAIRILEKRITQLEEKMKEMEKTSR